MRCSYLGRRSPTTTATLRWLLETHSSFGRNIPPMPSYGHAHIARLWASNLARNQNTMSNYCAVTAQTSHRQSCPTRKPLRQITAFPNSTKPAQLSLKELPRPICVTQKSSLPGSLARCSFSFSMRRLVKRCICKTKVKSFCVFAGFFQQLLFGDRQAT